MHCIRHYSVKKKKCKFNSNAEIKALSSEGAAGAPTDRVNSCSALMQCDS